MAEAMNHKGKDWQAAEGTVCSSGQFQFFHDLGAFSEAVKTASGSAFDLASLTQLNTDFVQDTETYLLLNVKEYGSAKPDNILYLAADKALAFSSNCPPSAAFKPFEGILSGSFGISTVLCFLVMDRIVDNHKKQLEIFLEEIKKHEQGFDPDGFRTLNLEIERFSDRLEEFHYLLLELQERRYKQVRFDFIKFDYRLLLAESQSLQARVRRRIDSLKRLQQDFSIQASEDLNKRILKLNRVVTRLTAVTVIFMLPTLVASHFGMNFQYMPELHVPWAYPAVIAVEVAMIVVGIVIFRKAGWL